MADKFIEALFGLLHRLVGVGTARNIFVVGRLDGFTDIDRLERVDFVVGMLLGLNHLLSINIII